MKLGTVLKKERERRKISIDEATDRLDISREEYERLEAGTSLAETWGPLLGRIAVELDLPTARLIAESGSAADARTGQVAELIMRRRNERGKTIPQMANALGLSDSEYREVESGASPLEQVGLALLRFAELVDQPVFNFFYPCGLPFEEIDDYP